MKFDYKSVQLLVLIILGIIFFFVYSFLIFDNSPVKFTWPDETANYYFINNYINDSSFKSAVPANDIAEGLVKPRSFNVVDSALVPGSFLGFLLIYGIIGKIIGLSLINYLTPLLAVIAGIYFYKIILRIFNPQIAFLSGLLFFINPAWWYYANLTMLPNIAFISLIIIGCYFLLKINISKPESASLFVILSAVLISLALTIRTNEFLWVLGLVALLIIVNYQRIKWYYVILFMIFFGLTFLPVLTYNQLTYGDYLSFGYLRLDQGSDLVSQLPSEFKIADKSPVYNLFKFLTLPFGFHSDNFLNNIYSYFIELFWWLFVPAMIGLACLLKKIKKPSYLIYFIAYLAISWYLILYYGSWNFSDPFTLELNKIGLSYVRYFLPIYILSLPLVALFINRISTVIKRQPMKIIFNSVFVISFVMLSFNVVYLSGNDNLQKVKQSINEYNQLNQRIVKVTEDKAIIISQRSDKIFFPERQVISKWQEQDIGKWSQLISQGYPLYYYAYEGEEYMKKLEQQLAANNLVLYEVMQIDHKQRLYKINEIELK